MARASAGFDFVDCLSRKSLLGLGAWFRPEACVGVLWVLTDGGDSELFREPRREGPLLSLLSPAKLQVQRHRDISAAEGHVRVL